MNSMLDTPKREPQISVASPAGDQIARFISSQMAKHPLIPSAVTPITYIPITLPAIPSCWLRSTQKTNVEVHKRCKSQPQVPSLRLDICLGTTVRGHEGLEGTSADHQLQPSCYSRFPAAGSKLWKPQHFVQCAICCPIG